ncbi:MAG: TrmH family RNA methyltransferase [Chloroflexota bacterium]
MQQITSLQNSKIKLANKLLSKRQREKNNLFLVDDARDLRRALDNDYKVEFAFYCAEYATSEDDTLREQISSDALYDVPAELIDKASYRQNAGGLVAVLQQKPALTYEDARSFIAENDVQHILGLADLRKPGNIGALLRTADATNTQMICLIDSALDGYNPNIIRASTGAIFLDNVYMLSRDEALSLFNQHSIAILAAHLSGTASLYDVDFVNQRTAIILGTEDTGLDDWWVEKCNQLVKVPMLGTVTDSLNVSVTGALFMYEMLRQTHHT